MASSYFCDVCNSEGWPEDGRWCPTCDVYMLDIPRSRPAEQASQDQRLGGEADASVPQSHDAAVTQDEFSGDRRTQDDDSQDNQDDRLGSDSEQSFCSAVSEAETAADNTADDDSDETEQDVWVSPITPSTADAVLGRQGRRRNNLRDGRQDAGHRSHDASDGVQLGVRRQAPNASRWGHCRRRTSSPQLSLPSSHPTHRPPKRRRRGREAAVEEQETRQDSNSPARECSPPHETSPPRYVHIGRAWVTGDEHHNANRNVGVTSHRHTHGSGRRGRR